MPDYAMPPFNLHSEDPSDAGIRRAEAVNAALELMRAAYIGGYKGSGLADATARLSDMADNIQQALNKA